MPVMAAKKSTRGRRAPTRRRQHRKKHPVRRLAYWAVVWAIWAAVIIAAYVAYVFLTMPQLTTWEIPIRAPNIRIIDRHATLIANRGRTGGEAVSLSRMSPWLPKAVIAIEDRRFYRHYGVDPIGIGRAAVNNLLHGRSEGGSTLTQQLAKNLFLSSERSFDRKTREAIIAIWLENKLGKDRILELYLNRVYLGSGAYGVEAAARRYFNKSAHNLTLLESATLAGLLKAPSRLSPARAPKAAYARAQLVLAAMRQEGMIDDVQLLQARAEPMAHPAGIWSGSENYVADYALQLLPWLLGEVDEDIIIETTLDLSLQRVAERSLREQVTKAGKGHNVTQGALVSLDRNGAIRAMAGGVDYAASQYNRAVEARRQPGSTFKPFVYLAALERGLTPNTVRNDMPIRIGKWTPRNAGNKYMGEVTLATALSHSLNSVAAQLIMETGTNKVVAMAHRLGIHTALADNASIALGTSEVSVLELTGAFLPLANGGYKPQTHLIRRIVTAKSKVLFDIGAIQSERVLQPHTVAMMNAMLEQTITSGTAKSANIGRPAAGKTGTSQNSRDAWFIGYTADTVTGVWLGNDNSSPMKQVSGSTLPVIIWKTYMQQAEKGHPVRPLPGSYRLEGALPGGNDLLPDRDIDPVSGAAYPPAPKRQRSIFEILQRR